MPGISEAEYRFLIDRNADGIVVIDEGGKLLFANPAAEKMLGKPLEELRNRPIGLPVVSGDEAADVELVSQNGRPISAEMRVVETSWEGLPAHLVSLRDVSSRRELEGRIRQSQKLEAIGQLTGGVAHDFNNLLTIIRSCVDLLRRPELAEEKRKRYIDAIAETADRAAKLTGQLLAFARRGPLSPQLFDVTERVGKTAELLETVVGSGVSVSTKIECDPCLVEVDPDQLETALINMAINSRDAMDKMGRIIISVREVETARSFVNHAKLDGPFVEIAFSDTGGGIDEETLGRVFEPFFTTKDVGKGTGLGLSQVYGFIKQSGGDIDIDSTPDSGTTIRLYLRKSDKPVSDVAGNDSDLDYVPMRGDSLVLVVEDNKLVGDVAVQLLTDLGYRTIQATDAEKALEAIECSSENIDLVFSDIRMPGKYDGVGLAREIQNRWPNLPVVLTSGYSDAMAQAAASGFKLLRKPYSVEMLSQIIRRTAS